MKKITVLHLRDSPWLCGPGRTIIESASHIDHLHYNYLIGAFYASRTKSNEFIDAAINRELKVFPIYEKRALDLSVISQIMTIVREHKVDFLHSHEFRSDIFAFLIHIFYRVPIIATSHGWIQNDKKGLLMTWIDKFILRFFCHVIVVSSKMRTDLLAWGVRPKRLSVIHNALVTDNFKKIKYDNRFRSEYRISNKALLIAKIGRLSPEKRQIDIISAAEIVSKSIPDIKFAIIGKGPDETFLKEEVDRRGLSSNFLFTGYLHDMQPVFNSLDLVLQASTTEGMPNVVLEALAYEIPTIATDVGGTGEIISDGVSGVLLPPKRPDLLAEKIMDFYHNPLRYRQMGINGRKSVINKFNFDYRTQKLMAVYNTLSHDF